MSPAKAAEPASPPRRVQERFSPSPTEEHFDAVQGFIDGIANLLIDAWWDDYTATHTPGKEEPDG